MIIYQLKYAVFQGSQTCSIICGVAVVTAGVVKSKSKVSSAVIPASSKAADKMS